MGAVKVGSGTLSFAGPSNSFAGAITGAVALLLAGGTTTLKSGTTASVADFPESGAGTMLSLAEILSYAGDFREGAGSTLTIKAGDKLTLTGTSNLAGTVSGAGRLALAGGSTTIASGAELSVANWTFSGARTHVALDENLTYAGTFSWVGSDAEPVGRQFHADRRQ
jgi:fibronectin-binding autotransporter adhesin